MKFYSLIHAAYCRYCRLINQRLSRIAIYFRLGATILEYWNNIIMTYVHMS